MDFLQILDQLERAKLLPDKEMRVAIENLVEQMNQELDERAASFFQDEAAERGVHA